MTQAARSNQQSMSTIMSPVVVVGTAQGTVVGINTATGIVNWRYDSNEEIDALAIIRGSIFVALHTASVVNGDQTGGIICLSARNGGLRWHFDGPQLSGRVRLGVDSDAHLIFAGSDNTSLLAIDAPTGSIRWVLDAGSGVGNRLLDARHGLLYVREEGFPPHFSTLKAVTGSPAWRKPESAATIVISPNGDHIAAVSIAPDRAVSLRVLSPADGAELASLTLHRWDRVLAITDEALVLVIRNRDSIPQLYAIDGITGEERWATGTPAASGPHELLFANQVVVAHDALYYTQYLQADHLIEVGALDTQTGEQRWRWQLAEPSTLDVNANSLVGENGHICLATHDGLRAFEPDQGRLLWHAIPTEDLAFITPTFAGK